MGIAALAALVAFSVPSAAQEYPVKPITLMVPYAAGGPTDIVARSLGQTMGKALQQTVLIENAVGAGGTIAPAKLKSAAPDGYTLLLAHIGMSTAPALYKTLPFAPLEDFELIGQVVDFSNELAEGLKLLLIRLDLAERYDGGFHLRACGADWACNHCPGDRKGDKARP
jgi:tripartite-type tricarboxylate transporter receptor subunit TctC